MKRQVADGRGMLKNHCDMTSAAAPGSRIPEATARLPQKPPRIVGCSNVSRLSHTGARNLKGHEWDHVAATAFLPARETFFAQNGTSKKGTNTKVSRAAKRPA